MDHHTESREIHLLFTTPPHTHPKTEIVGFTQHFSVLSHFLSSPFHLCVLIPAVCGSHKGAARAEVEKL